MKLRKRRIVLLLLGASILVLGGVAQISSYLTPTLARYPLLLAFFGDSGMVLLGIAAITCLIAGLYWKRRFFFQAAFLYAILLLIAQVSIWGRILQLGLAGLTVGGGLLLLGGSKACLLSKPNKPSL